jgi:glycosyltransferase involved in cell wall biosynthesis
MAPGRQTASGGIAVLYASAHRLRLAGFDAAVLTDDPLGLYPDLAVVPPTYWSKRLRYAFLRDPSWTGAARKGAKLLRRRRQSTHDRLQMIDVEASDVLVVPEFMLDTAVRAFPKNRRVVFMQNSFSYLAAVHRLTTRDLEPQEATVATLAISQSCLDAADLAGATQCHHVPVGAALHLFPYRSVKELQVAWMPRKRRTDAFFLERAFRRSPALSDVELRVIDNMTQTQVSEVLGESLVFVSLMQREALGFPAMEAMAAGCFTVGYTGFGTREYFTEETGRPVEEGDLLGVVEATESAINEWKADPSRIDDVRAAASRNVHDRYGPERCEARLLDAFEQIERSL